MGGDGRIRLSGCFTGAGLGLSSAAGTGVPMGVPRREGLGLLAIFLLSRSIPALVSRWISMSRRSRSRSCSRSSSWRSWRSWHSRSRSCCCRSISRTAVTNSEPGAGPTTWPRRGGRRSTGGCYCISAEGCCCRGARASNGGGKAPPESHEWDKSGPRGDERVYGGLRHHQGGQRHHQVRHRPGERGGGHHHHY